MKEATAVAQQFTDINLIDVDPQNPRGAVTDVAALVASIRVRGQEDPVQLIPKPDGRYWLHEGHRRLAALLELGRTQVWYIERHFASERDRILSQGTLHLHRVDFDPIAWAEYLHRLYWKHQMNRQDLAHHLGRSTNWVRETMALAHLEPQEKHAVTAGTLTKGEALWRLGSRRAELTGAAPPPPRKPAAPKDTHFTSRHPLARTVRDRCVASGEQHATRRKIGGVGCGHCWEHVIRDDATATLARPVMLAA
jgi:ParB/RepB/Spo0J family partition protein